MLVRDVMTPKPHTIRADQKVQAVRTMCEWGHFRHVPVVDRQQRLVGVVSSTDVLRVSASDGDQSMPRVEREMQLSRMQVADVMTKDPLAADPETDVADAARLMLERRVNCLPVVELGRVVGIVTAFDLLGLICNQAALPRG